MIAFASSAVARLNSIKENKILLRYFMLMINFSFIGIEDMLCFSQAF
jgi:hypothetical protein